MEEEQVVLDKNEIDSSVDLKMTGYMEKKGKDEILNT